MRPNSDAHSTGAERVAGLNQSLRLIRQGKARRVYLAGDADRAFAMRVLEALRDAPGCELVLTYTAAELAELAGVEVPTAVIAESDDPLGDSSAPKGKKTAKAIDK